MSPSVEGLLREWIAGRRADGHSLNRAVFDDALRQLEAQQFILAATGPREAHDLCAREFSEMYVACRAAPLPPEAQRLMPAQLLIQIEVRNGYRCG